MILLLDTSAVVGWLERVGSGLPELISRADDVVVHPVTLGELAAGVELATSSAERTARVTTLDFVTKRLGRMPAEAWLPARHFAVVQARAIRRLSHNDMWIVASSLGEVDITVATEDQRLADLVLDVGFRSAVVSAGLHPPDCELFTSESAQT